MKVVGLGELLWDVYPDGKTIGGAPANVARHAQQLGAQGILASAVGMDPAGEELLATLAQAGFTTDTIQQVPDRPTGTVQIHLDEDGNPHFTCSQHTAFDALKRTDAWEELARSADAVTFGTLAQRAPESRETIQWFLKRTPGIRVFDVNFRGITPPVLEALEGTLPLTDILKVNEEEATALRRLLGCEGVSLPAFLKALVKTRGFRLGALSLGPKGCYLTDGIEEVEATGLPIRAVDTTGCGDAFVAALIVLYLEGKSLVEMAPFLNGIGAFVATRRGAVPAYTREEVTRFVTARGEARQLFPQ